MFGGWNHTHYTTRSTSKIRRELVTQIKEGQADADRATQKQVVIPSQTDRRSIIMKRAALLFVAVILTVGGAALIIICLVPGPFRDDVRAWRALHHSAPARHQLVSPPPPLDS